MGLEHAIAFLAMLPDAVSARTGIVFESDHDDLDAFRAAVLRLANGSHAALQCYENAPVKGTTILVDDNSMAALRDIAALLRLEPADVAWVSPQNGDRFLQCLNDHCEGNSAAAALDRGTTNGA